MVDDNSQSLLIDSCLLVNRRVEHRQQQRSSSVTRTEITTQQKRPSHGPHPHYRENAATGGSPNRTPDHHYKNNSDNPPAPSMQQSQQHHNQQKHIGSGLYGTTTTSTSSATSSANHNNTSSNHHPASNGHGIGGGGGGGGGGIGLDQLHHQHQQLLLHHDNDPNNDHPSATHHLPPTVAASSTASLVSSSSRTHSHKQQSTTQQVTTVTKVVREVQHHHLGSAPPDHPTGLQQQQHPVVDYVAMPLDMQHLGPDGQPVDYVAMPLGMYPRSQYINYSHMDPASQQAQQQQQQQQQQQMYMQSGGPVVSSGDPQYGVHHGGGGHPHYAEYDHFPSAGQYANAVSVVGGQPTYSGGPGGPATYLGDYGLMTTTIDHRGGGARSPSPSDDHSGSQSPHHHPGQGGGGGGGGGGLQPVAYGMQTAYDDMVGDYRITPSPGGAVLDHASVPGAYQDDPSAMVYGYVSTSPYGTTGGGGGGGGMPQLNPTYGTRPVVYDDQLMLNGGGAGGVGGPQRVMFDNEEELQKHMAALALHGHGGGGGHLTASGNGGVAPDDDPRSAAAVAAAAAAMRWRDPNLTEVISFLNNPNNVIKANAAAYLQHLCYMDDPNKQRTRTLGGIPPLVKLLAHDGPEVYRNACGALRNLSYGRQNDENKRAIKNAGGIAGLIGLLRRTTESDVKELVTGVVWNMSSCEDLKRAIIDDGVAVVVTYIVIPHSGWDAQSPGDTCWSNVFRNASGVLRNVSSAGEYARTKLRDCDGLVDALLYVVRSAIAKSNIGNKIVENCVCILRNLSYRCQEVEDPNYDKLPLPLVQTRVTATPPAKENLGCFGASKKKKENSTPTASTSASSSGLAGGDPKDGGGLSGGGSGSGTTTRRPNEPIKGYEMLWQPDVVHSYLALLQSCSNPETLEAAAGALQNLAACYWQPSIEIRAAVRKEKGLPILVELLRMEVDRVVCAVATALRNLAIDQRNKELIGKYAMRDLVQKLPSGNPQHDQGTSDDTIAAVLATLNEVIKKNAEFSRSLLDAGGVERLMNITRQRQKYTPRVLKFAGQVLFTMWQHPELRDVYKKHGWKEPDFVTKTVAARNAAPNSPNNANSTLNRPMASQSGTRYEDRTMKRQSAGGGGAGSGGAATGRSTVAGGGGGGGGGAVAGNGEANGAAGGGGGGGGPIYQRVSDIQYP